MADEINRVDPGIPRLLKAVGKAAAHRRRIKLDEDFYEGTIQKERFIWELLRDKELFPDSRAEHCLVLRFGMSGHREHTPSECAEHKKIAPCTPHEVNQQIDQSLKILASCLILGYALTHNSMGNVTLEYMQLSVRTMNVLKRGGVHNVGQLSSMPSSDLLGDDTKKGIYGFGRKSLAEVEQREKYGGRALRVF